MNVWRSLHEENLYPYHDQRVQHLEPGDHAKRMDLCHWVNAHSKLLNTFLFTDETSFTRDRIKNLRNVHTWAHLNPHVTCVILFTTHTTGWTPLSFGCIPALSLDTAHSDLGEHLFAVYSGLKLLDNYDTYASVFFSSI